MSYLRLAPICLLPLLLAGCVTQIDYLGRTYPATSNVDLYFVEEEIPGEYEVIGQLIATVPRGVSTDKLQADMIEEARKRGADALFIESFEAQIAGSYRSSQTFPPRAGRERRSTDNVNVTVDYDENIEVRAQALRFRR